MDFIQFFSLIGSIGLFLYGMKLMSEGLQKIFDDSLRNVHASMTRNRFMGVITGILLTALVQASSSTMVMIVSFVNAGLISLAESLAVVMGANLGNTVMMWIIATLGFKFNFMIYIFPLIALSLPFFQSSNSQRNSWGEFLIGFALLFLGLTVFQDSVPMSESFASLAFSILQFCNSGILPVLLFILSGALLTMLVQASSLTFTIALLLCVNEWIPFTMGCAIILGANLGTCIMPILAARKANTMAKRAALSFLFFNIIGTIWVTACFFPFCNLIENICLQLGFGEMEQFSNISMGIALFHTLFNLINVFVLLPFTKYFVKAATRCIAEKKKDEESFKLQYINNGLISSGQISLIQVRKETSRYAEDVNTMFRIFRQMIDEPLGSERQVEMHHQICSMEVESDRAEVEIADFLNQISHKTLSADGELMCRNLYKMVDELESIADSIFHMSNTLNNKQEQRVFFNQEMNSDIRKMIELTDLAMTHMCQVLQYDDIPSNALNKAYNYEDEINNYRNQLRNAMLDRIDLKQVEYMQSTYFMLLVNECEKIGDYAINVIAAACEC